MFSLPLNPFLSKQDFTGIYLPFLKQYKHLLDDIYFTCRIPPFTQDAMGMVIDEKEDKSKLIKQALYIQQETGVAVNAVFNSPAVSPDLANLELFIKHFQPLYREGIHRITMIQAHWVSTLKHHFPRCHFKSSVVRPVDNAQNFVDYALLGYDVVQIDRHLMRHQAELKNMAKARSKLQAQQGITVDICLLATEQCRGLCPVREEHYLYNVHRQDPDSPTYMASTLCQQISCHQWQDQDPAYRLKVCDLPPWKKDWDRLLQYVQTFKLHGRDDIGLLMNSLRIIKNFDNNAEVLDEIKYQFLSEHGIKGKKKQQWLKKIANCQSQCWNCNLCDVLMEY